MGKAKYPKYKPSKTLWQEQIPSHWQETELRILFADNKNKNVGLIERNLLSLSYGKLKRKDIDNATGLVPASFEGYQIIDEGYIVLRFTDLQNDKKSLRVGYSNEKGIITNAYVGLAPKTDIHSKYFYYQLHFLDKIKYFYNLGGGVRQSLAFKEFGRETVLIPEKDEQIKIANFLDFKLAKIERFIQKKKELIKLLNEQKASIVSKAVSKGINANVKFKNTGIEWLKEVPAHWKLNKIKFLITKPIAGAWGADPKNDNNDIICVRVADFKDFEVKTNNLTVRNIEPKEEQLLKIGDLLLEKSGGGEKTPVGRVVIFKHNFKAVTSNFVSKFSPKNERVISEYLLYVFKLINSVKWNFKSLKQTTGIQNIDTYSYLDNWIYIPEISEQEKIIEHIQKEFEIYNSTIDKIEKELALTEEYRTSIIAEAVTGKIDVREYEFSTIEEEIYEELEEELDIAAEDEPNYEIEN
jgi:type I restriction enzyme S subunit